MGVKSFATVAALCFGMALGQQPEGAGAKQEIIAGLKKSIAENQAALKQYAWTETTQISLKGEVKKQEQKECQYGPDGKVQKTPMDGASQPQQQQTGRRGGRVKQDIVQKKVGETKDYMEQVGALVHEYVPPDPQRIQAAQQAGNISVTPARPVSTITIKNYLKPGDSVVLGLDTTTKRIVTYDVSSFLDNPHDDPVKLAVTFAQLPDGTNYAQQSILDAPAKKIEVKVTNSDHRKRTS
jgi:hypothetical protein